MLPGYTQTADTSFYFYILYSSTTLELMVGIKMEMASFSLWETVTRICEVAHFESVFSLNGYQPISWCVLSNVDHTRSMVMLYSHGSLAHG